MSLTAPLVLDTATPTTPSATMVLPVLVSAVTGTGSPVATQVTGDALRDFFQGGTSDEFISTVAVTTPSALTATQFTGFASTVSGAVLMGYGTTWDVGLKQRSGTTAAGVLANSSTFAFVSVLASTTAIATPSALAATAFNAFASTVSGAAIMGFGTTHDVALKNQAGTTVFGITANTTNTTLDGTIVVTAPSVTAASPSANVIATDGAITLDRAGGTIDGGAHSFYPVRGVVTVTATTTVKEAFLFGMRAGATIAGVIDQTSATRVGALFAKLDVSAATLTAGQVSVAWFDWGSSATTPTSTECNVIRVQNTTAAVINALIYGYGKSTFLLDLSDNSQGTIVIGTPPTTLSGSLKISANGNTRYIPLYTNPS